MGKYIKCLSFIVGIGTELHSVKGKHINSSIVNMSLKTIKCYVNKFFALFLIYKII